jgi:diguanylate cyclase (GGDEF)-like protein
MLVVYVLSDSSNPPQGLGLYTVYFMAALLGWIAVTLQQSSETPMAVDVPAAASIITSYILFAAAGQRAGMHRGRLVLGLICLVGSLCVFFLPPRSMFTVQHAVTALFFAVTGGICAWRAWRLRNVGDAIIAYASLLVVAGVPAAIYQLLVPGDFAEAQTIAFGINSAAYALIAVGFLASVLIEYQQHLSHLATEDPLTRLLNRRGLQDALSISMAHAARKDLPIAAIQLDIDHFKQINDTFGHEVGDHVIQEVAAIIQRMSRASDVVARTGGEEFLLVLPDTDLAAARVLAERIRLGIGDHPLLVDNQRIPVTVSLGVTSSSGDVNLDDLSQDADRAMYMAKRAGRNRVATVENRPLHLSAEASRT